MVEFTDSDRARILRSINIPEHAEQSECWTWLLSTDKDGYPLVKFKGKTRRAHRVVYMMFCNTELESCVELDHLCHNRRCVNPYHLECVSKQVNIARMHEYQRYIRQTVARRHKIAMLDY